MIEAVLPALAVAAEKHASATFHRVSVVLQDTSTADEKRKRFPPRIILLFSILYVFLIGITPPVNLSPR